MHIIKQDGSRTICEASLEAQLLYDRLSKAQPGEELTYQHLSEIAARNVQTTASSALQTARKRCENLDHIVFSVIRGVGLRRLLNEEIPKTAQSKIDHIRRTAKRAAKRLACVDYDALSRQNQITHNINLSMLGVLAEVSKTGSYKLLENRMKTEHQALPVGKVLELFRG